MKTMGMIGLLLTACLSRQASAQLITYSFTGSAGNESSFAADQQPIGGMAGPMQRGPGLTPATTAGTFNASGWSVGLWNADDYYSFKLEPEAGFSLSLTELRLDERRSSTGIRDWVVRSSLDNFSQNVSAFAVPDDSNTRLGQSSPLGAGFQGLTAPVEFRIYGFNAESAAGTWRIDNVQAFGAITPVPEPQTYAMVVGIGLVGWGIYRRCGERKK